MESTRYRRADSDSDDDSDSNHHVPHTHVRVPDLGPARLPLLMSIHCHQTMGVLNAPRRRDGPGPPITIIANSASNAASPINLSNISALPLSTQVETLQSVR